MCNYSTKNPLSILAVPLHCPECTQHATPQREPLLPKPLPDYPWQKVVSDLFTLRGTNYLVVVDYFSCFPEVIKFQSTTSNSIILAMKSIFSRYGIPEVLISDNGPQCSSQELQIFQSNTISHLQQAVPINPFTVKFPRNLLSAFTKLTSSSPSTFPFQNSP